MSQEEERRNYIFRLAMALINGEMGMWNSATEEERIEAKEYLDRAGIVVPEARRHAKTKPMAGGVVDATPVRKRRSRLSLASKELAID